MTRAHDMLIMTYAAREPSPQAIWQGEPLECEYICSIHGDGSMLMVDESARQPNPQAIWQGEPSSE